jgi:hypothetical protein
MLSALSRKALSIRRFDSVFQISVHLNFEGQLVSQAGWNHRRNGAPAFTTSHPLSDQWLPLPPRLLSSQVHGRQPIVSQYLVSSSYLLKLLKGHAPLSGRLAENRHHPASFGCLLPMSSRSYNPLEVLSIFDCLHLPTASRSFVVLNSVHDHPLNLGEYQRRIQLCP